MILCVLFMFFVGWKTSPELTEILCLEHNVCFYPFFLLGYYAKRFNIMNIVFNHNIFFTVGIIGYFCVSILFQFNDGLHTISDRYLVPSFAIIAIVYYFHHRETKNGYIDKYLGYIGTKTLDIYLYHYFFIFHFNIFNIKEFSTSLFNSDNTLIAFFISLPISIILIHISILIGNILKTSTFFRKLIYGQILK